MLNIGDSAMQDVEQEGGCAARLRGLNPRTSLERHALRDVDLDVPAGVVTAVIGPTASGKTTLLQLVAGLLPPTRGDLTIWDRKEARPGQVGMVMQRAEMQLFCATVREDVAVAPRLAGLDGRALEMRVEDALLAVGLDPEAFGDRSPHALSLGEQRRVALAGILSLEPRLLVLDEPGAGLDPLMRRRLMERLLAWREEGGHTLLYASHDMEEVARVADHVVLLAGGRIVGCGPAAAILGDEAALAGAGMRPPLAARVAAGIGGRGPLPVTGPGLAAWLKARDVGREGRA